MEESAGPCRATRNLVLVLGFGLTAFELTVFELIVFELTVFELIVFLVFK